MIETLKTLCMLSGVSGMEDEVRDYILERAMPFADEVHTDAMGNLMVFKKGAVHLEQRIMLCAHMDEVGLIVTRVEDEGYIRFQFIGGVDRRVVLGKRVFIGQDRIPGVIGVKAVHLVGKEEQKNVPKVDDLYVDIGAKSKEEAQKLVQLGDRGVFDESVVVFGDGYIKAKAIDDRSGCAVMLKLLEEELPCDTWFAFTVQEEVGTRGAHGAAFRLKPDIALVLEGTTAADLPYVEEGKQICRLGKGPVITFMDRGTIYDRELRAMLIRLAEENGIVWQTKEQIAGGTDGSAIQRSREGVRTAIIATAVRNIHSPVSVAHTGDAESVLRLARLFLHEMGKRA
ncbi:MAG: M42 family metallopeptidase [Oscillospiraceae bacterium]|nr:M42 family metallopeptidase [Oscillospiraceae bacterium]